MTANAGRTAWHRGVPAMRIGVWCQGQLHHVLWKRGALVLENHDAVADRVVVALGGEPPPCLDVLRSWRLGYVEVAPRRSSAGLVRSLSNLARWMSGGLEEPVVLPEPLRRLREASILHTWGRGLRDDRGGVETQSEFLSRSIARRLRDVARLHAPWASGVEVVVDVDESQPPSARRVAGSNEAGASIAVQVRPSWLTDVWVVGLEAAGDDGFVLAIDAHELHVARWELDDDGRWDVVVRRERRDR